MRERERERVIGRGREREREKDIILYLTHVRSIKVKCFIECAGGDSFRF
jgi:hypothetical protein